MKVLNRLCLYTWGQIQPFEDIEEVGSALKGSDSEPKWSKREPPLSCLTCKATSNCERTVIFHTIDDVGFR